MQKQLYIKYVLLILLLPAAKIHLNQAPACIMSSTSVSASLASLSCKRHELQGTALIPVSPVKEPRAWIKSRKQL